MELAWWSVSEEVEDRFAFSEKTVRAALPVSGFEVDDAHRVIDGPGHVRRRDLAVGRVLAALVAGAVGLPAADAAAGQQDAQAVGPVVAAGPGRAAAPRVADLRLA